MDLHMKDSFLPSNPMSDQLLNESIAFIGAKAATAEHEVTRALWSDIRYALVELRDRQICWGVGDVDAARGNCLAGAGHRLVAAQGAADAGGSERDNRGATAIGQKGAPRRGRRGGPPSALHPGRAVVEREQETAHHQRAGKRGHDRAGP